MGHNPLLVTPPSWLKIDADSYRRLLNSTAVSNTKRAKKHGATYQVKEAMEAIHAAFHRCDGTDPYDGLPLDGRQLEGRRCPTVCPIDNPSIANFEVLSHQTKEAKGAMNAEEFIAHCRAVVAHADATTTAGTAKTAMSFIGTEGSETECQKQA